MATAKDLYDNYFGLAKPLFELTARDEGKSLIDSLRRAINSGDPAAIDAALRDVIRTAQQARKIIKSGPSPYDDDGIKRHRPSEPSP